MASIAAASLESDFASPPDSARPWVYWFWLNGNITEEAITADLEAMQRVGIGGVLIMEVDQGVPVGPVDFMSDEWRRLFHHVVSEAQRLGLEVNMNNDAGWNGSGGPWITPELSMQKVVWTELEIEGPKNINVQFTQPETLAGFYRDIAVLVFPTPGPYRIPDVAVKALFQTGWVSPAVHGEVPAEMIIPHDRVLDISTQMDASGKLAWDAPPGKWTIVRFGHTSTGVENAPAPTSGRGLECDKLSKEGIEANFNGMMAKLIEDAGPAAGKSLVATHIDSWENGAQNWTARMRDEFKSRRGYDPLTFLPAMAGRVVGSLEISERFLWDLRQTVSELIADNYAGHLRDLARQHGMRLSIEAYGGPCDDLPYAGRADEPMSEFWVGGNGFHTCKEMASAAHVWGANIMGAEAFTANDSEKWLAHPGAIKALGDSAFCAGVNRFVFHRYALQPWVSPERRPGMTMGPWGIHYERTQTWWDMLPAWHLYLARCQYMLRQGRYVADIAYLQPEAAPQSFMGHPPNAYAFDNIPAEAVMKRMADSLSIPGGPSYRVLVLPDVPTMTPELLGKIKQLVENGATVIGPRPVKSPSLAGYPQCDADVQRLAGELWADCDGKTVREHRLGAGRVGWGVPVEQVLQEMGVRPDFETRPRLNWIHRVTGDADLYFVANPHDRGVSTVCTFRVAGKAPELWWPDTGTIEKTALWASEDGRTRVHLALPASGSVFVVFRKDSSGVEPVQSIWRDGQPAVSVAQVALDFKVTSATYGVPGDPGRSRDVAEELQRRLDTGTRTVQVAELALEGDPAIGVVKTLTAEYTAGGRNFKIMGQDKDTVYFTDEPVDSVEKAIWGPPGDLSRSRDVREEIQRILDTGAREFEVMRLLTGGDPAVNVLKTLVVEYTSEGQRLTASATDPEVIAIGPLGDDEAAARVVYDEAGRPVFETRSEGRYEVRLADGGTREVAVEALPQPLEVSGPWDVTFPPNWGAPERITLDKLASLSTHADPAVAHFSGIATWGATFNMPADWFAEGRRFYIDLGRVEVMARVAVNGKGLGVLWKSPYTVEVTDHVKPGDNTLKIEVANLWINRMIGDAALEEDSKRRPEGNLVEWPQWVLEGKPSPTGRYTFSTWNLWPKDAPLPDSGLIGPVRILAAQRQAL
ncbi:MAG TPA: glycosyl hydrolase [Candidatus Bathyarchaeia archaeon]|nr:glycosyl hydrolase [Candidatus Bathyarchaeia archaeon]